ncbi:MAG: rhodanese-like domain-containing protein [Desulfobulbaceae bacterium]|nr:rhodanese-like domain-containing protein [Desulfobulbaceae bacterium]HIJ78759.1 rhodanese-like domain-containing protein [Deltaproteobacteria bacterium]
MIVPKKIIALCSCFLLSLFFFQGVAIAEIPFITTPELKQKIDAGEKLVLANALSPIEFSEIAIKGSVNIPASRVEGNPNLPSDKDTLIIFYCLGPKCGKSRIAAEKAVKAGYTNIMVYNEGLPAWAKKGLPLDHEVTYPKIDIDRIPPKQIYAERDSLIILDIRGKKHMALGKIAGTVDILLDDLDQKYTQLPKDKKIVVADHAGKQLNITAKYLHSKGYTNIAIMDGGVSAWLRDGLPVTK